MTLAEAADDLETRLEKLSGGPSLDRMRARLRSPDDRRLFRINPYTFAAEEGVDGDQSTSLFLRASAFGLFRAEWLVVCRGCGEYVVTNAGLRNLASVVHCLSCARDREANLDDSVEVVFTVHPDIRTLRYASPARLELEDYFFDYVFSPNILVRGTGRTLVEHVRMGVCALARLAPGESHTVDLDLEVGWVVGSPRHMISVEGEPTTDRRELTLTYQGHAFLPRPTVSPGPVRVTYCNATDREVPLLSYFTPIVTYFDYRPFLSGQRVLNTEDFRRSLGTEVVRPGSALPTRDDTLLFTDLRGSTALYDHVGDMAAFELVSAHLELLAQVISRHSGVVVKTIGDAVMASFSRPADAVRAALEMGDALQKLVAPEPLGLKIGVHRGPCLVVNVRDEIDYFGQTVNVAARVQGAAKSGEVCMSAAVFDDPEVHRAIVEHRATTHSVGGDVPVPSEALLLHGVSKPCLVYRYQACAP